MADPAEPSNHWWSVWLRNPAAVVAAAIVMSVIALVSAATLGVDHGVLKSMGDTAFARGLITYLFAIVTIGTAVVLVMSTVVVGTDGSQAADNRFQHGKEILSLLLGVFGTIVGFYFGQSQNPAAAAVKVSPIYVEQTAAKPGDTVTLRAYVSEGKPPYRFTVAVGSADPSASKPVSNTGWINEPVSMPKEKTEVTLTVTDTGGSKTDQKIQLEPAKQ